MSESESKSSVASPGAAESASVQVSTPVVGEMFAGRYTAERRLGRGAMGEVWAVLDQEVGDRVALKLLTAELTDSVERFRREVRLARRVTHRNAVRTFDLGLAGDRLYLTMELVEGESLADLLGRQGTVALDQALSLSRQIVEGLAAAHAVGVVHRDLKPANVLIAEDGRVVLTDFGLARTTDPDVELTRSTGTLLGTPAYMAPEQVKGEPVGPYTDVFAFGAMLYQMVTGRYPYERESAVATALARLEGPPENPARLAAIPEPISRLILSCMEREPRARPASAAELLGALSELQPPDDRVGSADTLVGSTSGVRSLVSSGVRPERSLAVLPFRHRGPSEQSYIAETIAEELTDVLTMTRGLKIIASGATAGYRGKNADPREAGRELGVDAIVEGTLQAAGDQLRLSARLIEVASGTQLWVGRFEGQLDDVFELQETLARRIAEALRVELEIFSSRHVTSPEAIDLYLQARQRISETDFTGASLEAAMEMLERAISLAPDFTPAIATLAYAAVRRWFLPGGQGEPKIAEYAHEMVERALEQAPHLAQSHFAAGRLAVSDGRFDVAARELKTTLSIAPTYAGALAFLGMLECEAGRSAEGVQRIEMALRLDPTEVAGYYQFARNKALDGDYAAFRAQLDELSGRPEASRFALDQSRQRVAAWFGDLETVRRLRPESHFPPDHPMADFGRDLRGILLGEVATSDLEGSLEDILATQPGPRLASFFRQLAVEALALTGDKERALRELKRADESGVLIDADWLERCPALDSLRDAPELAAIRDSVWRRANAIWRAG